MIRRFLAWWVASALVLGLALAQPAAAATAAQTPLEIDVVLPLTGPGAFVGKTQQDTLSALQQVVNREGGVRGRPIHFVFNDDQTSPQVALELTNAIVAKHQPVMIGSSLLALCRAMGTALQNGPVEYCLSPGLYPPKGSFAFSASVGSRDLIGVSMRYMRDRGWNRIATLNSSDATGLDADHNIAASLADPGYSAIHLVAAEHFAPSDIDVSAQLARIKAANPQVLVAWTSGAGLGTVLRALSQNGYDIPVVTVSSNMIYAQMKQYAQFLPKDFYFQGIRYIATTARGSVKERAVQQQFLDALAADHLGPPDFQMGMAWDPAMILVDALRHVGPEADPTQIRDYISTIHDYIGIAGVYDFRDGSQRGLSANDLIIMKWDPQHNAWTAVSHPGGGALR